MYVVVAAPAQSKQLGVSCAEGGRGTGVARAWHGRGTGVARAWYGGGMLGAARRALGRRAFSTGGGTMHASSGGECLGSATA